MSFNLLSFFKKKYNNSPVKKESVPIRLFNSISKMKEQFEPVRQGNVYMYSCGPTVYSTAHIGNLRSYVFSDTLRRMFEYNDYKVKHVINITDVGHLTSDSDSGDDKMMTALKTEGLPITLTNMKKIGSKYIKEFKEDLKELNIKTPFAFPRASDHIDGQIAFIKTLEEKGYTYTLKDGIYFETKMFKNYGALGGISKEDADTISRIGKRDDKHTQQDFALWKFSTTKTDSDKKLGWKSPWGVGFPGWHIECSAMSSQYLGKQFDLHTGGIDHKPIHHNNEIAQTEAITGKRFVNYWMHNAFITIENKRIGKSEGNAIFLRHLSDKDFPAFTYRYWLLTGHYRSHMNFTWEALEGAKTALIKLHKQFLDLGSQNGTIDTSYQERFHKFINDDINTAQAIALLHELMSDKSVNKKDKRVTILDMNRVLSIGFIESYKQMGTMLKGETKKISVKKASDDIQELVEKREEARKDKDWKSADSIREKLDKKGIEVSDTNDGPELTQK